MNFMESKKGRPLARTLDILARSRVKHYLNLQCSFYCTKVHVRIFGVFALKVAILLIVPENIRAGSSHHTNVSAKKAYHTYPLLIEENADKKDRTT
jgi:hypothetical protein